MSESIIADFVGTFNAEVMSRDEPVTGRVLLSEQRLVLAASEDDTVTIPLSSIFDVGVGHIPPDLGDFFDSTVTIAFERGEDRFVAAVEGTDDKITKFSTVLFKSLLNGTETTVKERARVGGRVTGEAFTAAELFLRSGSVEFRQRGETFVVSLETVTNFQRTTQELDGATRPTLTFRHMVDGTAVTTMAVMASPRKMSILGRFLRLEYSDMLQDLRDIELTTDKKEILIAMYSTGDMDGIPLANVVGGEPAAVTMLLQELEDDGLVHDSSAGPTLTPKGDVVVGRHLEDVNS